MPTSKTLLSFSRGPLHIVPSTTDRPLAHQQVLIGREPDHMTAQCQVQKALLTILVGLWTTVLQLLCSM